ncbi:MAG: type III pantothenate kinase [Gammaproteobacteria bacterium]|nr:type III pantothenate kinase [Gammaproteobacteria bacterium]MYA67062.1 type III pantothenate kinase [Gammaproteobacteria bacterium]MYG95861.1 type III pantothenate kinase [Gammaproteobacteria bacterium]MYH47339.1 type III pantothenate kinase [Gammaproteobacteria bacterium]MYL12957.1 type III pantothenate kinase [Gammaproteobacteria bacterium]
MILEIDAGNTSLKWRWRGSAASSVSSLRQLESAIADARRPDEVLVCNVRGEEFEAELTAWLVDKWELRPQFATVARVCGGVRIQYPDPSRLGADRWLAMLAGFRIAGGSCLVVDSGTALTIDMLDAGGLHLGGYIMPGLETSRAALTRDTSIRLAPADAAESAAPGNDTAAAVRNGTLFMLCSAVRAALERRERQDENTPVILTGGDAAILHAFLQEEIGRNGMQIVPDLVLDGLALTCPDERNENCATS